MPYRPAAVALAAALASGCALFSKRPDTPAAKIDRGGLARLPPPPGERYYLLVFGSESRPKRPETTHTWATLVTARCEPGTPEPALDVQTISWLPATLNIRPDSREVEPGKNFDLDTTIAESLRTNQEIAVWGPFEVWHGFAHRFRVQKEFLESGRVGYQCIDSRGEAARTGNGHNCIHAVSDMDPLFGRGRYALIFYGQAATANLVGRIMNGADVIDPPGTHDWVFARLAMERYPLARRAYKGPFRPYSPEEVVRRSKMSRAMFDR